MADGTVAGQRIGTEGRAVVEEARPRLEAARADRSLPRIADELLDIARVLTDELRLRRALADPMLPAEVKTALLGDLLADRVHPTTLELLSLATARRMRPVHMVDLVEQLGAQALLAQAEADGDLDDVEDDLFRFARLLDRERALRAALADATLPTDRKLGLVDELLSGRARPASLTLVRHVIVAPRGRHLDRTLETLAELAAAQRGHLLAEVTTARPLDAERETRLRDALTQLKGRPVDLQVTVDPSIMGGVIVRIGEELYDGSARRQLDRVREQLG